MKDDEESYENIQELKTGCWKVDFKLEEPKSRLNAVHKGRKVNAVEKEKTPPTERKKFLSLLSAVMRR